MNGTAPGGGLPLASIDIGSHTIRLLSAILGPGERLFPMLSQRHITRLARGFQPDENLEESAIRDSLSVLSHYAGMLKSHGIRSVCCGATGVVRRARNRSAFLKAIEDFTGLRVDILSESREAYLSAKGTLSVLPSHSGLTLSFDLGGSSTEFLLVDGDENDVLWSTSIFTGAATLTERHLSENHLPTEALPIARTAVRSLLEPAISTLGTLARRRGKSLGALRIVGTAGTVSTLAAMFLQMRVYDPDRVNGLVLTSPWVDATVQLLAGMPPALRRELPGLEEGREDIILGGALIVQEILASLHREEFTVTDGGLLEGILLDLAEREMGWPQRLLSPLTWETRKR